MKTIEQRATEWLCSHDTGVSSKAICAYMLHGTPAGTHSYPSDGSDLGRCLRLLKFIPEWEPRIAEMGAFGPYWSALVERWNTLENILAAETGSEYGCNRTPSPRTYRIMRKILDPIIDADRTVARLGTGVTVRFGD